MPSGDLVTRLYSGIRGVDFRGEEVSPVRSPDMLNMWKDRKETDSITTRPGLQQVYAASKNVFGIFFFNENDRETIFIHAGTMLVQNTREGWKIVYHGLNPAPSQAFVYNNKWYMKDGQHYIVYDGETIEEVIGYIPTTSIGRSAEGGGTPYEDVNLLTSYRKNAFRGDGTSTTFHLDARGIDADYIVKATVNGNEVTQLSVNPEMGTVTFTSAPPKPATDGQDNIIIQFRKTVPDHRERIDRCTLLQVFDNRVFFAGNPRYPTTLFHCSLNDPTYVSDLDYYDEGMDESPIRSIVAGNNALWVMKKPADGATTVFYHVPVIDHEYGKIYPSTHSSITLGCVGRGINFNDDIVFFSQRGMEAVAGDIESKQFLAHRSTTVDGRLLKELYNRYNQMILTEYEGYLLVFTDRFCFLADSKAMFHNEDHYEYEWFYWEMPERVTAAATNSNGELFIGTATGLYIVDNTAPVNSHVTTAIDKFNNPQYLKTTNKKGCVIEAEGDFNVSVKTNKSEWTQIGNYENITDYCVARIKMKKFKDIQLKFASDTRFKFDSATLECYVGGYNKR